MNFIKLIVLLFILFLFSCKNSITYKKHEAGFEYKIISKNKDSAKLKINDVLDLSLKYSNQQDSVIFNSDDFSGKFRIKVENGENGMFQTAISLLHVGDSAHFIIPAKDFYENTIKTQIPKFVKENDKLKFELRIKKLVTEQEMKKEHELYIIKMEAQENSLLQEYLKNENITVKPTKTGLYIIFLKKGNGAKAKFGNTASIHYKGSLINGEILASSIDKDKPLTFTVGNGEVIKAWDEVVQNMRIGDKVKIIVPSKLAYGEFGYKEKIPPFSTLIFEIKLLKLK